MEDEYISMEDEYIRLLKEIREHLRSDRPMTYDDFKQYLKQFKIKQHAGTLYRQIYNPPGTGNHPMHMGLDVYMMLLEYDELKQAREDSKQARQEAKEATNWARRALIVSIVAIVVQIVIAIFGICQT